MLAKIREFIEKQLPTQTQQLQQQHLEHHIAAAALLIEVARADTDFCQNEHSTVLSLLAGELQLTQAQAQALFESAVEHADDAVSLYDFTKHIKALDYDKRLQLILALWQVAYADGELDPHEEHLIRHVAELIYVRHSDFIRLKLEVTQKD